MPVAIRLLVTILPAGDDVLILGNKTLREQLGINLVQALNTKTMGCAAPEAPVTGGTTPSKRNAAGAVRLRQLSASLLKVQTVADCEEEPGVHVESYTEVSLARGPAMVMGPDQGQLFHLEALESAADQAAHEGMSPKKPQQLLKLVLGEIMGAFHRSLMGDPTAKVTQQTDPDNILRAVNCMQVSLPALVSVIGPLRALLDELMAGTRRTKRVASNRVICEED